MLCGTVCGTVCGIVYSLWLVEYRYHISEEGLMEGLR